DCRDACIPDDLKDERDSCRAKGGLVFNSCTPGCLVPVPGRCTLTHECVDRCRDHRNAIVARCLAPILRQIHAAVRKCKGLADCLTAAATERTRCRAVCRASITTSTTLSSITAGRAVLDPLAAGEDPCSCVARAVGCVQGLVGGC